MAELAKPNLKCIMSMQDSRGLDNRGSTVLCTCYRGTGRGGLLMLMRTVDHLDTFDLCTRDLYQRTTSLQNKMACPEASFIPRATNSSITMACSVYSVAAL